jgi:hypothetical protein
LLNRRVNAVLRTIPTPIDTSMGRPQNLRPAKLRDIGSTGLNLTGACSAHPDNEDENER